MSRILFFNIPAHGHTNPTLGMVRERVRRGHQVRYYSYEPMREKIEDTGAAFIACDSFDRERHLSAKDAARVGKDLAFSVEILTDTTLALEEMVRRDVGRFKPDCIVADSMAVWGKAAARDFRFIRLLIRDDFPTLDLPMKANSGNFCFGFSDILVLLPANNASVIFIMHEVSKSADKDSDFFYLS